MVPGMCSQKISVIVPSGILLVVRAGDAEAPEAYGAAGGQDQYFLEVSSMKSSRSIQTSQMGGGGRPLFRFFRIVQHFSHFFRFPAGW